MQKDFNESLSALLGVGFHRPGQKILGTGPIQMALFLLRRIPGPKLAFEDNPISGVPEHMSGTAGRPWISSSGPSERQANVTDAFPRCGQSPTVCHQPYKEGCSQSCTRRRLLTPAVTV